MFAGSLQSPLLKRDWGLGFGGWGLGFRVRERKHSEPQRDRHLLQEARDSILSGEAKVGRTCWTR